MKSLFEKLFQHELLSYNEAKDALGKITDGNITASETGAFIAAYRMRSLSVPELKGFRDALLERALLIKADSVMDLCGTGGDNKNTFNISTLASFVAATCGVRVAKHGNYGVSSTCGSSHVLEGLGIKFKVKEDEIRRDLDTVGIAFLHAPLFHPALKNVAGVRKELGFRTFFNILGPLVNPTRPTKQLCGVLNTETARLYTALLGEDKIQYSVITSLDGYDEVSLTGPWKVYTYGGDAEFTPSALGFERVLPQYLDGGSSVEDGVKIFKQIVSGRGSKIQNSVVCANAAFAIMTYFGHSDFFAAYTQCLEALLSGKAEQILKRLVDLN